MKRFYSLIALMLFNILLKAQEPVVFKIKYLPNYSYKATMKTETESHSSMPNRKSAPQKTTELAMSNRIVAASEMKTGAIMADGDLPITIRNKIVEAKFKFNGKESPVNQNQAPGNVSYGEISPEGKIHIDSITGAKGNEQQNAAAVSMINKIQGQIKFPDKPMKIGETITQDASIDIPGERAANMDVIYSYKLTDIKSNKAYFDIAIYMKGDVSISQPTVINGNVKTQQNKLNVTASGTGKLVFDMLKNYTESKSAIFSMRSGGKTTDGRERVSNMKVTTDIKNEINPL